MDLWSQLIISYIKQRRDTGELEEGEWVCRCFFYPEEVTVSRQEGRVKQSTALTQGKHRKHQWPPQSPKLSEQDWEHMAFSNYSSGVTARDKKLAHNSTWKKRDSERQENTLQTDHDTQLMSTE